jgi:hypothetical protein
MMLTQSVVRECVRMEWPLPLPMPLRYRSGRCFEIQIMPLRDIPEAAL